MFVLTDEVYKEFLLKFLEFCGAQWPLKLWLECRDIIQCKSKLIQRKKLVNLNKQHFQRNPGDTSHYVLYVCCNTNIFNIFKFN